MPTLQQRRLLFARTSPITYLFGPFIFGTAQSAPLTSPYVESGVPGSLTISDIDAKLSVASGVLVRSTAAGTNNIIAVATTGLARVAGRALFWQRRVVTLGDAEEGSWGWHGTQSGGTRNVYGWVVNTTSLLPSFASNGGQDTLGLGLTMTNGVVSEQAVVLRATGAFYLVKVAGAWTLMWVAAHDTTATLYPSTYIRAGVSSQVELDNFRATDLGGAWSTDFGIATQRLAGARGANDTFVHTANTLLEFVVTTLPSAGSIDVQFRVQDASNYWIARISTTGALSLIEVVATVETSRGTAAGVISNGHRVVIIADGTTIAGYSNSASRWTYASASNFQSSSAGLLGSVGTGGAVSDLVTWPRNPTLPSGV